MNKDKKGINRRTFLKTTGIAGAALGSIGVGLAGYQAGSSPDTYTGVKTFEGGDQTFNRKKHEQKQPTYQKVGPSRRIDVRTEMVFSRFPRFMEQWKPSTGLEGMEQYLKDFYKKNPDALKEDIRLRKEIFPKFLQARDKYKNKFVITKAWSNAMGDVTSPFSDSMRKNKQQGLIKKIKDFKGKMDFGGMGKVDPPKVLDFPQPRNGRMPEKYKFKDPKKTSRLLKKMAHQFGSVLVGITELNPDWVYGHGMKRRGFNPDQPFEVPKHWKYAIVVGTPMTWDPFYANPNYGTSYDAYAKSMVIAFRLTSFIKQLGYAARPHTPGADYDLMVPPILVDAGLGEQGRHSVIITPELGCNFRPAVVTTNLPLAPDKPIDFGVQDFCKTCKICAANCPSGAITLGGKEVIRGYKRYKLNVGKCRNFWYSNLGNIGCRLCLAVCPYSRKSNWLHKTALNITTKDFTGISHKLLTSMQKIFYPGPKPDKYYIPSMGGENASYKEAPWWLVSENFIDF